MVQHYFVAAWVPPEKLPREFYMRKLDGSVDQFRRSGPGVIVPVPVAAPGSKVSLFLFPSMPARSCKAPSTIWHCPSPKVESARRVCGWWSTTAG
jgi:hypothetical protein